MRDELVDPVHGVHHRGDLGHTHTRHDPRGADRPRADADLDGVRPRLGQVDRPPGRRDVARDDLDIVLLFDRPDGVEHVLAVPVRGIDDEHIRARLDQRLDAVVLVRPDRGAAAEPTPEIDARVGVAREPLDVAHCDEPDQPALVVEEQQLLDLVAVHDVLGLGERCARRGGDQVLRGHHLPNGGFEVLDELEVPSCQDAKDLAACVSMIVRAVLGHREPGDMVLPHQFPCPAHGVVGAERDRVGDHPVGRPLDLRDLAGLHLDGQVLVDDPHAPLERQSDRERGLGHRVHRGAHQRDVEPDSSRQPSRCVRVGRQHLAPARDQQDVVERDPVGDNAIKAAPCGGHPRLWIGLGGFVRF